MPVPDETVYPEPSELTDQQVAVMYMTMINAGKGLTKKYPDSKPEVFFVTGLWIGLLMSRETERFAHFILTVLMLAMARHRGVPLEVVEAEGMAMMQVIVEN